MHGASLGGKALGAESGPGPESCLVRNETPRNETPSCFLFLFSPCLFFRTFRKAGQRESEFVPVAGTTPHAPAVGERVPTNDASTGASTCRESQRFDAGNQSHRAVPAGADRAAKTNTSRCRCLAGPAHPDAPRSSARRARPSQGRRLDLGGRRSPSAGWREQGRRAGGVRPSCRGCCPKRLPRQAAPPRAFA